MSRRSALLLILLALGGLSVASASGEPNSNTFTAAIAPASVRPFSPATYTFRLTNRPSSDSARQAKIGIPSGFDIESVSVSATTGAVGDCSPATWVADGALLADGKINLKWPGESSSELCSDGVLTVTFRATSPSAEGAYAWPPELFRDSAAFTLRGGLPTVTVDGTAPDTTIVSGPPNPSSSASASFGFSSNEPGSTFRCSLDGAAFADCSSPTSYSGLADGPHTFQVRSTDQVGNTGSPASYTWTIDTTAPDTTIVSGPPSPSSSASASFGFSSNEPGSTFRCSLDGAAFADCSSPTSYSGLADGPHTFQVKAADRAGNTDPSPVAYSWTVATTVPDRTPPGNVTGLIARSGDHVVTLSWTPPTDLDLAHVSIVRSQAGASAVPIYLGTRTRYIDLAVQNGVRYLYTIVSYDRSGNASDGVTVVAVSRVLLLVPRRGGRVTSPPLLVWRPVPAATYYNVQLFQLGDGQKAGAKKVLSAWPSRARLRLRSRWVYQGRRYRLRPGLYRWYVWPGFRSRAENLYGELLGQSTFVVAPSGP